MKFSDNEILDAICNNQVLLIREMLKVVPVDYRIASENNDTLLLFSISDNASDIYKIFLANGADTKVVNDEGENILHCAVYSGRIERVREVIEEKKIDGQSNEGVTPLLLAISLRKTEIAHFLLDSGAVINVPDKNGSYPIHVASSLGLYSLVESLVKRGADLKIKTKKGNYPLALAVNNDHSDIVSFLFSNIY